MPVGFRERAGRAAAVLALFVTTVGPVQTLRMRMTPTGGPALDLPSAAIYGATYAIAVGLIGLAAARRDVFGRLIAALAVLAVVSTLWSVDQATTLTDSVLMAATIATGIALGSLPSQQIATAVWAAMHLGAALSLWAKWRHWPLAYDQFGQFAGIYLNRNSLAPVAALGLVASGLVVAGAAARRERLVWAAVAVVATIGDLWLLKASRAAAAVLAVVVAVVAGGVAVAVRWTRERHPVWSRRLTPAAGAVIVVAAVASLVERGRTAALFGRKGNLHGRIDVWRVCVRWIREHPVRGFGWMSVWTVPDRQQQIIAAQGEPAPFAHNFLLEIALGMGVIGLVIVVAALIVAWRRAGWSAELGDPLPVVLVAFSVTLFSLDGFFDQNRFPLELFVCCGVLAARRSPGDRAGDLPPDLE